MSATPIIDTHVHLWDTTRLTYGWLKGAPILNRPMLPADYDEQIGALPVEKIVFVQADCARLQSLAEFQWVTSLAETYKKLAAVVAFAPLEKGDSAHFDLDALVKNDSRKLLRGIRRLIQGEADPDFSIRPDFVRGVQLLADYKLSFDLCIVHTQLPNVIKLVEQSPKVAFILDHIAKPDIQAATLDPWREQLRELSHFKNVACKISGMVTEADAQHWKREQLKPYVDHVIDCFGWDRILFGSDWPVCRLAATYENWVKALQWMVKDATPEQQKKLFHDNAVRAYRL